MVVMVVMMMVVVAMRHDDDDGPPVPTVMVMMVVVMMELGKLNVVFRRWRRDLFIDRLQHRLGSVQRSERRHCSQKSSDLPVYEISRKRQPRSATRSVCQRSA